MTSISSISDTHRLVVGEYVSVKEADGQTLTFKIVAIT